MPFSLISPQSLFLISKIKCHVTEKAQSLDRFYRQLETKPQASQNTARRHRPRELEFWRHFSKAEDALRRLDQLGKLEIIANLARNLLCKT